ncbi:MAG: DUF835 domain-containing protein [Methanomassiliicoccales archaeon]|jgi:hypothetical protein
MRTDYAEKNVVMMVEGYPRLGFRAFGDMISDGTSSICISRLHPDYVAEKYTLTGPRFYWLTGNKGDDVVSPKSLSHIVKSIKKDSKGKRTMVFLDGLEYLLLWNDMKKVLTSLDEIGSMLKVCDGALYVSIDPLAFEQKDIERIWAMFPRIEAAEMIRERSQQNASISQPTARQEISGRSASKGLTASP